MEHKLANIQNAFDSLSTLVLRNLSKWRPKKRTWGEHPEIIDRMAEQIESVITQLCKESKLWVHPNL